ncbi:unnamed protein product [Meloidogyne enterolobii]|uniref:Uncharacterized protein n=1 Tax=Meloidogyne enterolobii TaxID=390850 RepID=A0ACB0ZN26_MELEN
MSRTEQRHQLLELLGEKISEPERTDFNLDRWLEAYDEVNDKPHAMPDIKLVDSVRPFEDELKNRVASFSI